jgi:hypothetical protein
VSVELSQNTCPSTPVNGTGDPWGSMAVPAEASMVPVTVCVPTMI